jgi:hypothetical protein
MLMELLFMHYKTTLHELVEKIYADHLEEPNQEGICRSSVVPGHCLREHNTVATTPSKVP